MGSVVEVHVSDEDYEVLRKGAEKRNSTMREMCGYMVSIFLGEYTMDKAPRPRKNFIRAIKDEYDFFVFLYGIGDEPPKKKVIRKGNLIKLGKPIYRLDPDDDTPE